jgi:DNA polymerase III subunit epsilon
MSKILYLDSETGGLNHVLNPMLNLACIIEIDGEVKDERLFLSKGFPDQHIDPKALEVNGLKISDILKYPSPEQMHSDFTDWLGLHVDKFDRSDKYFIGGYKVDFDMKFVKELFKRVGDEYLGSWINGRKINPLPILEWLYWRGDLKLPDLKLATVCNYFNIELVQAHDAMADIRATRELIRKVDAMVFDRTIKNNLDGSPELSWLKDPIKFEKQ